jgi:hypothetical protein
MAVETAGAMATLPKSSAAGMDSDGPSESPAAAVRRASRMSEGQSSETRCASRFAWVSRLLPTSGHVAHG